MPAFTSLDLFASFPHLFGRPFPCDEGFHHASQSEESSVSDTDCPAPLTAVCRPRSVAPMPEGTCISSPSYTVQRTLGAGGYGTAFAIRRVDSGELFAAKLCGLDGDKHPTRQQFTEEADKMDRCRHFAVVRLHARYISHDGTMGLLIMDLGDGGDLRRQIRIRSDSLSLVGAAAAAPTCGTNTLVVTATSTSCAYAPLSPMSPVDPTTIAGPGSAPGPSFAAASLAPPACIPAKPTAASQARGHFSESDLAFLFYQIVLGTHHIHQSGMLHRDLKPHNVFVTTEGIAKIGDFGLARDTTAATPALDTSVHRPCGTEDYLAPENWRGLGQTIKSDVWALGVLLYELASLKRPFRGSTALEMFERTLKNSYEPLPMCYSDELCDLVDSMLAFNPDDRPTPAELLASPYLAYVADFFTTAVETSPKITPQQKRRILADVVTGRTAASTLRTPSRTPPAPLFSTVWTMRTTTEQQKNARMCEGLLVFDGTVLTLTKSEVHRSVVSRHIRLHSIVEVMLSQDGAPGSTPGFKVVTVTGDVHQPGENERDETVFFVLPGSRVRASEWVDAIRRSIASR
jgi:serine/threonine protein kinase